MDIIFTSGFVFSIFFYNFNDFCICRLFFFLKSLIDYRYKDVSVFVRYFFIFSYPLKNEKVIKDIIFQIIQEKTKKGIMNFYDFVETLKGDLLYHFVFTTFILI